MNDTNCPYCDAEVEINHDDGYGYSESELHEQECGKCNKMFTYTTIINFYYDTYKADCLNGGEHVFKEQKVFADDFIRFRCETCWIEKDLRNE
jgi:hypothetical protein